MTADYGAGTAAGAGRVVCLDVEPGGASVPDAWIGVCDVTDEGPGEAFTVSANAPEFADTWAALSAFIGAAPLVFYNRAYDRAKLRQLLLRADVAVPTTPTHCALVLTRRRLGCPAGALADVVHALGLFTEDEINLRRRMFFDLGYGNKWMLNDAADDALACARLVAWHAREAGAEPASLFSEQSALALNRAPAYEVPDPVRTAILRGSMLHGRRSRR